MQVDEVLEQASNSMSVRRVFGEPFERDGVTVIPVARVSGGGGGGGGEDEEGAGGTGVGFGLHAAPAGVYVITGDKVKWEPAVDVNKIVVGGQVLVIVFLLVLRSILKSRQRSAQ
jgi:uncharacterized spore protein YtfJ